MDIQNTPSKHALVGSFSLIVTVIFHFLLNMEWALALARVAFILLFLIMIIGPLTRIKAPAKQSSPFMNPWSWRGELGIWFAIMALAHFILLLTARPLSELIKIGGSGYSLTNFIGLVALILTIILAFTSVGKVILFLGVRSWERLHGLTYVVFYLVAIHFIYFQFFSNRGDIGPDWFGYMAIAMTIVAIILQAIAFIKIVARQNKVNKIIDNNQKDAPRL